MPFQTDPVTPARVRAFLVEDEVLMGRTLGMWLRRIKWIALAGRATDCQSALTLGLAAQPDLALVDLGLPDGDGLDLAVQWLARQPGLRLLILSARTDPHTIWRVGQSGCHGYVDKTQTPETLLAAIQTVASGGSYFSPVFQSVTHLELGREDSFQRLLSPREVEVLQATAAGEPDELTARGLGISPGTVMVHRRNVRTKLGLHSDRELMSYARGWGLDRPAGGRVAAEVGAAAQPCRGGGTGVAPVPDMGWDGFPRRDSDGRRLSPFSEVRGSPLF